MEELIFGSKEHINAWQECARALVITQADLDEALRAKSVEDVAETRLVTLEPSGKINVLAKK